MQAPKGTEDVLPEAAAIRDRVESDAREVFERAGFGRIATPVFEDTELFVRSVGEATDIVEKEMFTFDDLGGRSVTLRPEGTAPVCRAYVQHGMHKLAQPVRLWYAGSFFRYEAPQAGRYRQFSQLGIESIGSHHPEVDAESIALLDELMRVLGVPGVKLHLGSLGSPEPRAAYREELRDFLRANESQLAREVRERIDANPLRAFDAKDADTRAVMAEAPKLLDRLAGEDVEHFNEVRALLDALDIDYELDPGLVRGLDYYNRTVFAVTCDRLGAQSEIGGGGRYDGLVAELGGQEAPGVGWAAGIERIALALASEDGDRRAPVDAFVVAVDPAQRRRALVLVSEMRRKGLRAQLDLAGRSIKGQFKQADRVGARRTVILEGEGSTQLRDMASGEQRPIGGDELLDELLAD